MDSYYSTLTCGQTFASWKEFHDFMLRYELATSQLFVKIPGRTTTFMNSQMDGDEIKYPEGKDFKYVDIMYVCYRHPTMEKDGLFLFRGSLNVCRVKISARWDLLQQAVQVNDFYMNHSHPVGLEESVPNSMVHPKTPNELQRYSCNDWESRVKAWKAIGDEKSKQLENSCKSNQEQTFDQFEEEKQKDVTIGKKPKMSPTFEDGELCFEKKGSGAATQTSLKQDSHLLQPFENHCKKLDGGKLSLDQWLHLASIDMTHQHLAQYIWKHYDIKLRKAEVYEMRKLLRRLKEPLEKSLCETDKKQKSFDPIKEDNDDVSTGFGAATSRSHLSLRQKTLAQQLFNNYCKKQEIDGGQLSFEGCLHLVSSDITNPQLSVSLWKQYRMKLSQNQVSTLRTILNEPLKYYINEASKNKERKKINERTEKTTGDDLVSNEEGHSKDKVEMKPSCSQPRSGQNTHPLGKFWDHCDHIGDGKLSLEQWEDIISMKMTHRNLALFISKWFCIKMTQKQVKDARRILKLQYRNLFTSISKKRGATTSCSRPGQHSHPLQPFWDYCNDLGDGRISLDLWENIVSMKMSHQNLALVISKWFNIDVTKRQVRDMRSILKLLYKKLKKIGWKRPE